jgi:CubicO group peptidase (beta-lactamase class C family)
MPALMRSFPPAPGEQVTLANWRTPPFSTWAFHHVRELIPSADIAHQPGNVMELPAAPMDPARLGLDEFIRATDTDALAIVHRGRLVFEHYANGTTAETPHILMSVTKSMLGLLAGILAGRGALELERRVTEVLPELKQTGYEGATIRQLLDMRSGIAFEEDYLATSGPIVTYRKASGWNPLQPGEQASDLRSFYRELAGTDGPHGGPFRYISPNTDLLGWVIERATGRRYADLMSELLWKPMGAERSAYITVDRLGAPRTAGGMCTTLRDLARVGQLMVEGGRRNGAEIIPAAWLEDLAHNGDAAAWAAGSFVEYFPGLDMHYRAKWYVLRGSEPLLFGWGIHGQNLFVDRARQLVIAKFSSQALPVDVERIGVTLRSVARLRSLFGT